MSDKEGAKKHHEKEAKDEPSDAKVKAGDVVVADFDGWISDSNELFDTTSESVAKENNVYNEKVTYGPQPLIVGKGRLFKGLDDSMVGAEIGKEYELVLTPDKAAGPRDPKLVELHPVREFLKQEIEPRVGMEVTVKNKPAIVTAVTAGRVRLDFNNRLAGRTLKYKYKILERPEKPVEIAKLLLKMSYGTSEGFDIEHHGKSYKIKLPDACKYDQRWLLMKYRVVSDLRDLLGAETISFVEEYAKPEKKEEEKKAEEKKAEEPVQAEQKPAEEKKPEAAPETERAPEELTEEDRKGV